MVSLQFSRDCCEEQLCGEQQQHEEGNTVPLAEIAQLDHIL
jgi:hypothetical protein